LRCLASSAAAALDFADAEPVAWYHGVTGGRDLDYALLPTRAAADLTALLRDQLEPSVQVRRWSDGRTDLLTDFSG
jgi:hypothetical protein